MPESADDLVSVVVPTFDGERYVAEALHSIVAQTYQTLEIVICDDGSSDATLQIARRFAAEDARIRIHVNDSRLGPVGNFARGLALASGPYVKYLMQDDVLEPSAIGRLRDALRQDDDIVLATSRRVRIDEHGGSLSDRPEQRAPYGRDSVLEGRTLGDLVLEENLNLIGEPSSVLFRRAAVGEATPFSLGGAPYRYLADVTLWLTLLSAGRAAYLVEPLSRFHAHDDQDSGARENMVLSVLEWQRLHREARSLGFLASSASWERACRRWLDNAPFFFRFCSDVAEASTLLHAIVAANTELLRLVRLDGPLRRGRVALRSTASCLHASLLFPIAGLWAEPIHRVLSSLRRRDRPGRR